MHGLAVTTVEGIGSTRTRLHPVQERIAKAHGSQCGFCTPGIVMSMYTLLRSMDKPSYKDLEVTFQGNLCRCTGYRPIIEGYKTFTEQWENKQILAQTSNGVCGMGDKCCRKFGNGVQDTDEPQDTFISSEFKPLDTSQEPIFPPELKLSFEFDSQKLVFKGKNVIWHRPNVLQDLLNLKSAHKDAKIVTGNTEIGVEVKFKNFIYPVIIMPNQVAELNKIDILEGGLQVGAAVTLTEMETVMKSLIKTLPTYKTRILQSTVDMLHWFAGKQIRNVAAVGGNIMTGSPISDLNPIFMAAGAVLTFKNCKRERSILMDHSFFTGYRKNVSEPDEILVSIHIPFTSENEYFKAYKQAKRRDDDIAIVNMAMYVKFDLNSGTIIAMNVAFGGMAPVTVMVKETSKSLIGQNWNEDMMKKAFESLMRELPLDPSAPGGMIQYRRSLTLSLFFKAYLEISHQLPDKLPNVNKVSKRDMSAIGGFHHKGLKSSQFFRIPSDEQSTIDPVGRPIVHTSAFKQATGEAVYCDDMPFLEGELYMSFVLTTKAHANILSVDASTALAMPGVKAFYSAADIDEERNHMGPVFHDEEVFLTKKVTSQGQVIGAIVAETQIIAQRAAKAVKVVYEELQPIIITIEQAIKAESYFPNTTKKVARGDVEKALKDADYVIENDFHIGGQEHFYLETQASRVIPKEDNELEIFSSTQHPSEISVSDQMFP